MLTPIRPMSAEDLHRNMVATYFTLRGGIVLLSAALPLVLYFSSAHAHGALGENSMSAFYGADGGALRNYFVATLCVVGALLMMYKGFSAIEDWLLNVAGGCAVLLSITPCNCWHGADSHSAWHTTFAVSFFISMVLVCEFCARDTITLLPTQTQRDYFGRLYHAIGLFLFLSPAAAVAVAYLARVPDSRIFFIEWFGVYMFAGYWLAKSAEFHITAAEKRALKGELKKVKDVGLVPAAAPDTPSV